mgnify:CR=1 FL=1
MQKRIGHKAGSGSQRKPVVAADSASSKSYANIVYGISEGEIVGLANGMKSVILDGTPVESLSGSINIPNLDFQFRSGTNDQEHLTGFPSVSNEIGYNNVELKSGTPFVHYINDLNVDAARVRFTWGKIFQQNENNGDTKGYRIEYAIDVQTDGNGFVEVLRTALDDKTSSGYERSHRIELPRAEIGWELRIRRITANSTSEYIGDKMYLSAVTEVLDAKLRYPNTALIGLKFDADYFGNIPKVDFRLKGKIIKVPANYDPETRTYATTGVGTTNGVWDGSFKLAYTNNPAWVFYDIILNRRYGLGDRLDASMVDKWSLYSIAKYCDVMVPDGEGGMEPRLTCNVYINNEYEAFTLLMQLASTFRGLIHWNGNSIVVDTDRPTEPVFTYTRANIKGEFNYSGTRARDRHSMFTVSFDDPRNDYKTDQEVVSSTLAISEIGVRNKDLSAFGCTSRGQAQRIGQWALLKEQEETRTVTFEVGLDGFIPITGKIIEISDPLLAGRATGGRISVVSSDLKTITVDRDVEIKTGDRFVVNTNSGTQESREVLSVNGRDITVTAPFTDTSPENVWAVESDDLQLMRFRVLSVAQTNGDGGIVGFTVSAVQHNPALQDSADFSSYIERPNYSVIDIHTQEQVTDFVLSSENVINQGIDITNLVMEWKQAKNAVKYELEWRKDNGQWIKTPLIYSNTYTVEDIYHGTYEARIVAINAMDVRSLYTTATPIAVDSKFSEPPVPASLSVVGKLFGIEVTWRFPAIGALNTLYTELQVSYRGDHVDEKLLGTYAYPMDRMELNGLHGDLQVWIKARLVDRNGIAGQWTPWMTGTTTNSADEILDLLDGRITATELDQGLRDDIAAGSAAGAAANEAKTLAEEAKANAATAQAKANAAETTANAANTAATNAQNAATSAQTAANTANTNANAAKATADQAKADVAGLNTSLNQTRTELEGRLATAEDGLSQEILDRTAGDNAVVSQLNTYKTSNDSALAAVQSKAESALSQSGANATSLTNLTATVNTKNRTYQQTTAPTANLVVGDLWINTTSGKNNETKRWNGSTWVDTTDPRIASTASALATLTTTVTTIDGKTSTNSADIVSLRNDLTTTNNNVATKADTTALNSLSSTVTQQGDTLTTYGSSITNLTNRMATVENGLTTKADASALNNIYTKTEADSKATEIAAGQVSQYDASLVIGGANIQTNAEFNKSSSYNGWGMIYGTRIIANGTLVGSATSVNASCRMEKTFAIAELTVGETYTLQVYAKSPKLLEFRGFANATSVNVITPAAASMEVFQRYVVTFRPTSSTATVVIRAYAPNLAIGEQIIFDKEQLEIGSKATAWRASDADVAESIAVNTTAISNLDSKVVVMDGKITTQATSLTNLTTRVTNTENALATKADASALTNIYTKTESDAKATQIAAGQISTFTATLNGKGANLLDYQTSIGEITKLSDYASSGTGVVSLADSGYATGDKALRLKAASTATAAYSMLARISRVEPVATAIYAYSVYVKSPVARTFRARLAFFDYNGTTYSYTYAANKEVELAADVWTRVTFYGTNTLARNFATLYVYTNIGGIAVADDNYFLLSRLMLERTYGLTNEPSEWVSGSVQQLGTKLDANIAATDALTTRVTSAEGTISTQGTRITSLETTVNHATTGLATKASTAALTALDSRVVVMDGRVTTNASNITTLQGKVTTVENGLATKADVAALSNFYTKTETDAKATTIAAGKVDEFKASLIVGNDNLLIGTDKAESYISNYGTSTSVTVTTEVGMRTPVAKGVQNASDTNMGIRLPVGIVLKKGVTYTLSVKAASSTGNINYLYIMSNGAAGASNQAIVINSVSTDENSLSVGTVTFTSQYDQPNAYIMFSLRVVPTGTWLKIAEPMLVEGSVAALWSPNGAEAKLLADTNASAITTTNAEVSRINDVVTTQGTSITNLQAGLATANNNIALKADGSALTALTTRVTTAEGNISSQSTRVTNLENSVNHATTGLATKASSAVVSALDSRVQSAEGSISTHSSQLTNLTNTLTTTTATANAALPQIIKSTSSFKLFQSVLAYYLPNSSYTESIVITTPITFSSKMFNLAFKGYNYASGKTLIDFDVSAYAYTTTTNFLQHGVVNRGSMPLRVRLGVKDGCVAIILSKLTQNFSYPQFTIDANIGYSTAPDSWATGWAGATVAETDFATWGLTGIIEPSIFDNITTVNATSAAQTILDNKVIALDDRVTANSTSITNLQSGLTTVTNNLALKADGSALTALTTRVTNAENTISTQSSQLTTLTSSLNTNIANTDKALAAVTVTDTRSTNEAPSWYWTNHPRRIVNEFKSSSAIGVSGLGSYVNLETRVYYSDATGGSILQTAIGVTDPLLQQVRRSNGSGANATWTAWTTPLKTMNDSIGLKADASIVTALDTKVSQIDGKVSTQATSISSLTTTVDNHTASISTQQSSINGLNAKATITVAAGNTVGGVALGNNGGTVDFIVRANTFAIAPPVSAGAGNAGKYAFNYQATAVTLPNGTVVPAGLYLDNAAIGQISASKINADSLSAISANLGTIKVDTAHIDDLAVTTAKIGNGQITTAKIGDLQVDTLKIKDRAVTVPYFYVDTAPVSIINKRYDSFPIGSSGGRTVPTVSGLSLSGFSPNADILVMCDVKLSASILVGGVKRLNTDYAVADASNNVKSVAQTSRVTARLIAGYYSTGFGGETDDAQIIGDESHDTYTVSDSAIDVTGTRLELGGTYTRRLKADSSGQVSITLWVSSYGSTSNNHVLTVQPRGSVVWYVQELKK